MLKDSRILTILRLSILKRLYLCSEQEDEEQRDGRGGQEEAGYLASRLKLGHHQQLFFPKHILPFAYTVTKVTLKENVSKLIISHTLTLSLAARAEKKLPIT